MKDIYIDAWQELYDYWLDQGLSEDEAEKKANDGAYDAMREKIADIIDSERQRHKDGA